MKKVLLTLIFPLLFFCLCSVCNADELNYDNLLEELGLSEYDISNIDDISKQMIFENYNENEVFNSIKSNSDNIFDGQNDDISLCGSINENNLDFRILLWNSYDVNGNLDYIRVEVLYIWSYDLVNREEDVVTISWDDSNFRYVDDSHMHINMVSGQPGKNVKDQSTSKSVANIGTNFIKWYADVLSTYKYFSGYATFKVEPIIDMTSNGRIQFYGNYVHQLSGMSLTVNIGSLGSITTSGDNYDEMGTSNTCYYNANNSFIENDSLTYSKVDIERAKENTVYTITDSGRFNQDYDIVNFNRYFGLDICTMKQLGYKYIDINLQLSIKEDWDGYQWIFLFSSCLKSNDYLIAENEKMSATSSYIAYSFSFEKIDINVFDENLNTLYIRYGASGNYEDDWFNKNLKVGLTIYK